MARDGALRLLHDSALHQHPDVAVELLLLRIRRLGQIVEEHRYGGDVLASPCKPQGTIDIRDYGLLDLLGAR
jgi:hypothetical protein